MDQAAGGGRGNLFFIPPDQIQRHTPRILDGAERLCGQLEEARAGDERAPLPPAAAAPARRWQPTGPLPGEIVTRIGQVAAIPADQRKVPGFAGAWRTAAAQDKVLERIQALEARRRPCASPIPCRPRRISSKPARAGPPRPGALDGAGLRRPRQYDVWYRFERGASRLVVADSDAADFQAELDPPYRRLRELAAARRTEEAAGGVRWLNLPCRPTPCRWPTNAGKGGWSADFVPLGDDIREWTQLVSCRACRAARARAGPALLEGMQAARATRCGVPPARSSLRRGDGQSGETLQTLLVCPQVPDTNFAELAVVKAIEGPDWLYVVQRAWRLPAGDADTLRADSRGPGRRRGLPRRGAAVQSGRRHIRPARRPSPAETNMSRLPQRIVCLSTETVEVLYLLGEEARIAGISGFTTHPPRARKESPRSAASAAPRSNASWPSSPIWCWPFPICRATSPAT
jgi:hypothetical protein